MNAAGERTPLPGAYWRLWTAGAISNLGDGVFAVALPLMAARITDDRVSVGLIATFFTIPWLLFAVPVGVLIDRSDRRRVMVTADTCRAALVGALALVAAFADVQIWMLWVLAFGLGTGEVFFDSTSQTIIPAIVPGEQLERANGYSYATEIATNTFLGMPLGSVLFGFVVWLPFGLDAASFVAAATLAASLRGTFRPAPGGPSGQSMTQSLRAGVRWLWHHRLLRSVAIAAGSANLAYGATQATLVLFALDELGLGERLFGPVLAIVGAGSVLAGFTGGRVIQRLGRRATIIVVGILPILTCATVGLFPHPAVALPMYAVQAASSTLFTIVTLSLRQQLIPDHLLGRVNSVYRWFAAGGMALGALAGSFVAEAFGLRAPYFLAAALLAVPFGIVLLTFTTARIDAALADASAG